MNATSTKYPNRQRIAKFAEGLYPRYVKAWLAGTLDGWFPKRMPNSAVRMDYSKVSFIQDLVSDLEQHQKTDRRSGYRIEYKDRKARDGGSNREISGIFVDSEQDLLTLAGKAVDFQQFQEVLRKLRAELPELGDWIQRNPLKLSSYHEPLDGLIAVVQYLKSNPRPGVFARELPLPIGSKFVEQHQGILDQWLGECSRDLRVFDETSFFLKYGLRDDKEHHAINLLDPDLKREYQIPFKELSLSWRDLLGLKLSNVRILFVENLVNLLTLPDRSRTIGIAAKGKFVNQFASLPWLRNCELFYWGDFDVEGFGILASFRAALHAHGVEVSITSLLMDRATFDAFAAFKVPHAPSSTDASLQWLTEDERAMFEFLRDEKWRLEQEYVSQAYVEKNLWPA